MIYIIRHGQTEQNNRHLLAGRGDYVLNDTGIQQARDAGEMMARFAQSPRASSSSWLAAAWREAEVRKKAFAGYQINAECLKAAKDDAIATNVPDLTADDAATARTRK